MLPRYVVNNENREVSEQSESASAANADAPKDHAHIFDIPDSLKAQFESLYDSYNNAENQEKKFIFANSLAEAYKTVGKLDSSARYIEVRSQASPTLENLLNTGDAYYEAFNFAVDQSKRNYLAEKAQENYKRVLEEDSSLLDVKSKLAMTYVSGSNPMQGIMMLREVLEQDPENELAIYNLGILAITSGQMDKALKRFEKLRELNSESPEANFYLGYCLFETGRPKEALPYFEKVLELDISGDMVSASKEYLKKINK